MSSLPKGVLYKNHKKQENVLFFGMPDEILEGKSRKNIQGMAKKGEPIEELKFTAYFKEKEKIKNFFFWKRELPLYNPYLTLKRDFYEGNEPLGRGDMIGRIDVMFRYRSRLWAGEVKWYFPHRSEFWDATKIIAYTSYYNWQNESSGGSDPARPAILVPVKSIKLEHKIVANKLKILLVGIDKRKDGYFLEEVCFPE